MVSPFHRVNHIMNQTPTQPRQAQSPSPQSSAHSPAGIKLTRLTNRGDKQVSFMFNEHYHKASFSIRSTKQAFLSVAQSSRVRFNGEEDTQSFLRTVWSIRRQPQIYTILSLNSQTKQDGRGNHIIERGLFRYK